MIDKTQIIEKLGKKGFVDFVTHNRDTAPTGAELQKQRRWGRRKGVMCSHGVWVVDNYEIKICKDCAKRHGVSIDAPAIHVDGREYFNIATGTYGTNQEHRRFAKRNGMIENG